MAKPLMGDVGVSPTTKIPLLLARRRGGVRGMRSTSSWIWHR